MVDNFFDESNIWGILSDLRGNQGFKVDVKDHEKEYVVEAELPGVKKEDITLNIENDLLSISVNTTMEKNEERKQYIRKERSFGSYSRNFRLDGIKEEGVRAEYKDGILSVYLPKDVEKQVKGRNVEIN
jgi:HSP20 family protein